MVVRVPELSKKALEQNVVGSKHCLQHRRSHYCQTLRFHMIRSDERADMFRLHK
jgi:hypothetical protein